MAQTKTAQTPATAKYTVLRAICMAGERVEVGEAVELTPAQYAEFASAGKVGPLQSATQDTAQDKPAKAAKPAKAPTTEATNEPI